ncbi:MAG: ferritin-like domain-containing protein, partial [Rhodospirillales bacterium]|nr:ferritin-like domain-containing protein [Acetobacter sp.]
TFAARGAGGIGPNDTFDAFANEDNFLLSAFIFEDVCVTALTGAAPLLQSKATLAVAAGLLGVEAYQAGAIRTFLTARGFFQQAGLISDARGRLDGVGYDDQGISDGTTYNISPTDVDGLAFARTPQEVLRIAYLNPQGTPNGFFPMGVNGTIR